VSPAASSWAHDAEPLALLDHGLDPALPERVADE
jgi:hypothetical protein